MKTWKLSRRLELIVSMIRKCRIMADIGCDHGYTCIEALEKGLAEQAIAADIGDGPLAIAKTNAAAAGVEDRCLFVKSDGFQNFPEQILPDTVCITGMGGHLIRRILKEADPAFMAHVKQIILGPQSDLDVVRRYVTEESDFVICNERMTEEDGKYYTLLDLVPRTQEREEYTESQYLYGSRICPEDREIKAAYLAYQQQLMKEAYRNALLGCSYGAADKQQSIKHKISLLEEAQAALKEE